MMKSERFKRSRSYRVVFRFSGCDSGGLALSSSRYAERMLSQVGVRQFGDRCGRCND